MVGRQGSRTLSVVLLRVALLEALEKTCLEGPAGWSEPAADSVPVVEGATVLPAADNEGILGPEFIYSSLYSIAQKFVVTLPAS